ncbi:MAG: hypothetical protein WDO73_10170 [Ignavibacteriota bacterium]
MPAAILVEEQDTPPTPEVGATIVNDAAELLPFRMAVTVAAPDADGKEVAAKETVVLPCRTVTVAGTLTSELLLDNVTATSLAGFETVTVQLFFDSAVTLLDRQVTDDTVGVDHKFRLALCDELPSVAFTDAVVSVEMTPAPTAKLAEALPATTITLAETVIWLDVELRLTIVLEAGGVDSSTVQVVVAPDITPLGLQVSPVMSEETVRLMVVD